MLALSSPGGREGLVQGALRRLYRGDWRDSSGDGRRLGILFAVESSQRWHHAHRVHLDKEILATPCRECVWKAVPMAVGRLVRDGPIREVVKARGSSNTLQGTRRYREGDMARWRILWRPQPRARAVASSGSVSSADGYVSAPSRSQTPRLSTSSLWSHRGLRADPTDKGPHRWRALEPTSSACRAA